MNTDFTNTYKDYKVLPNDEADDLYEDIETQYLQFINNPEKAKGNYGLLDLSEVSYCDFHTFSTLGRINQNLPKLLIIRMLRGCFLFW